MKKIVLYFFCLLFLFTGTVCIAGCGDDEQSDFISIGSVENQEGEVNFDSYSKSWYLRVSVPGTIDNVMEYYPIALADEFKKEGLRVRFSGEYAEMEGDYKPAGTECYQIKLSLIKKIE